MTFATGWGVAAEATTSAESVESVQNSSPADSDLPEPVDESQFSEEEIAALRAAEKLLDALTFHRGRVLLPFGGTTDVAELTLGERFYYLSPDDATRVLTEAWANPANAQGNWGMIVPAGSTPFDQDAWGLVINYLDEGHVSDEGHEQIDFESLLPLMREETETQNAARQQAGFGAVELLGWAAPPVYDTNRRALYWGKALKFEDSEVATLNFNLRILGRRGVLQMTAIGTLDQLDQIRAEVEPMLEAVRFVEGYRYEDFVEDTDRLADYGIDRLVAGFVVTEPSQISVWINQYGTGLASAAVVMVTLVWLRQRRQQAS